MDASEPHVSLLLGDLFTINEENGFDVTNLGWTRVDRWTPHKAFMIVIKVPTSWSGGELRWTVSLRDEHGRVPTIEVDGEEYPLSWVEDLVFEAAVIKDSSEHFTYRATRALTIPGRVPAGFYTLSVDVNGTQRAQWAETFEVVD